MKKTSAALWNDFCGFLKQNRYAVIAAFVFAYVCYGFMLTHYTLGIDEETWLMNADPELIKNVWIQQGRFGLYLFDSVVTPMGNYIPFFSDFMGVTLWTAAGVLLAYCITIFFKEPSRFSVFVFCAMFSSIPLAAGEILSFSMFSMQQGLAMLLAAFGVLCIYRYFQYKKPAALLLSVVFIFFATSFYQAFAGVFLTALVAYALVRVIRDQTYGYAKIAKEVLWGLCAVAAGVGAYALINAYLTTYVAPGGQAYLSEGLIGWGKADNALSALFLPVRNAGAVLLGVKTYGGAVIMVLTVLFLIFTVVCAARKAGAKNRIMVFLTCILLLISPFFMAVLLAQPTVIGRTLLALPFAMGVEAFLIINMLPKTGALRACVNLVFCALLLMNAAYMNLMFFHGYVAYEQDKATGVQIVERLNEAGHDENTPVIFIGKLEQPYELIPQGAVTGSFFSWDGGNNARIRDFLYAEGYTVCAYTPEQFAKGVERSQDMPCWPREGCIQRSGECIVVKLSEPDDAWYGLNIMV